MDIRGIHNVLSIDKVTLAWTHKQAKPATEIPQWEQGDSDTDAEDRPASDDKDADHPQKCAMEKLVSDPQQDGVAQFRVRWYDYAPEEDTWSRQSVSPNISLSKAETVKDGQFSV